jgi:hypothetical protein
MGMSLAKQNNLIDQNETYPYLPYQGFNSVTVIDQIARSNYNSLQATYRHQVSHGLSLGMNYTWSHAIDNNSSQYNRPQDEHNLDRWRGTSDLDRRHILTLDYVYDLPFFKNSAGWLKNSLGNWTVSGVTTFMSGTPIDVTCGLADYSSGVGGNVRCNPVGAQAGKSVVNDDVYGPTAQWFNVDAFTQPNLSQLYADGQPGMFGYLGRNTLAGPGRNNWDLSLFKNFNITERVGMQFRFETFNTWNHTQWQYVNTGCSDTIGPGGVCGTAGNFGQVNSTWSPRIIQMGLKLTF